MKTRKISLDKETQMSHKYFVDTISQLWQALMTVRLAVLVHHAIDPFVETKHHAIITQSEGDCFKRTVQVIKLMRQKNKSIPPALARKTLTEQTLREYCITIIFVRLFGPSTTNLVNTSCSKTFCMFNNSPQTQITSYDIFMEFLHNFANDLNMDEFRTMVHLYWDDVHRSFRKITTRLGEFNKQMQQLPIATQTIPIPSWNCTTKYHSYHKYLRANKNAQIVPLNEPSELKDVKSNDKNVSENNDSNKNESIKNNVSNVNNSLHASESKQQENLAQFDEQQIADNSNSHSTQTVQSEQQHVPDIARADSEIDSLIVGVNHLAIDKTNGNNSDSHFQSKSKDVNDTTVITTYCYDKFSSNNNDNTVVNTKQDDNVSNLPQGYTLEALVQMLTLPFDVHKVASFTVNDIITYVLNCLLVANMEIKQHIHASNSTQSSSFSDYIALNNNLTENAILVMYALLKFASTGVLRTKYFGHAKWLFITIPVSFEYANAYILKRYNVHDFFPFYTDPTIETVAIEHVRSPVTPGDKSDVYAIATHSHSNSILQQAHTRAHHNDVSEQPQVVRIPSILSKDNSGKRSYVSTEQVGSNDVMDDSASKSAHQQIGVSNHNNNGFQTLTPIKPRQLYFDKNKTYSNRKRREDNFTNNLNNSHTSNTSSSRSEQPHVNLVDNNHSDTQSLIEDFTDKSVQQINDTFDNQIKYLQNLKQHLLDNHNSGRKPIPSSGCNSTANDSPHKLKTLYVYQDDDETEAQLPHIAMCDDDKDDEIHENLDVDEHKAQPFDNNNGAFVPHPHLRGSKQVDNSSSTNSSFQSDNIYYGVNHKQRDIFNKTHGYGTHDNAQDQSSFIGHFSEGQVPHYTNTTSHSDNSSISHHSTHSLHNFPSHTTRKRPYQPPRMPAPGHGNGGNGGNGGNHGGFGQPPNFNNQQLSQAEFQRREVEKARINAQVREETKDAMNNIKRNFNSVFHGFPDAPSNVEASIQRVAKLAIAFIVDILLWYGQYVKPNSNIFPQSRAVSHIVSQLKSQAERQYTNDKTNSRLNITTVQEFVVYFLQAYIKSEHLPKLKESVMTDMPSAIEVKHNLARAFESYKTVIGIYNEIIDLAWTQHYIASNAEYNDLVASDDDVYLHIYQFLMKEGIIAQFKLELTDQLDPIKVPENLRNLNIAMSLYQKSIDKTANMQARIKAKKIVTKQRSSCTDPTATVAGKAAQAHFYNKNQYYRNNNRGRGGYRGRGNRGRFRGGRGKRQFGGRQPQNINYQNNDNYTNDPKYNPLKNRPGRGRGRGKFNKNNNNDNKQSFRGGYKSRYNKHNNNNRTSYKRGKFNNNRGRGRGKGKGKKRQYYKAVPANQTDGTTYDDAANNPSVNANNLPQKRGNAHQTHKSQNGHNKNNKRGNKNYSTHKKNTAQIHSVQVDNSDFGSDISSIHSFEYESPPPAMAHVAIAPSQH